MSHEYVFARKVLVVDLVLNTHFSSQAYYLRDQDTWIKIDYNAKAETWMKPLTRGKETGIVELPANWCVYILRFPTCEICRLRSSWTVTFHIGQVSRRSPSNDVSSAYFIVPGHISQGASQQSCGNLHSLRFIKSSANSHGWVRRLGSLITHGI